MEWMNEQYNSMFLTRFSNVFFDNCVKYSLFLGSLVLSVDLCNQNQSIAVKVCVLVGTSLAIVCNVQGTSVAWLSPNFTTAVILQIDPMFTKLNDMVDLNFMNQTHSCLLSNATIDNVQPSVDGLDLSCRLNSPEGSHANISIVVIGE